MGQLGSAPRHSGVLSVQIWGHFPFSPAERQQDCCATLRADPAILPRLVEKKSKELQRSVRNQAMGCLGATTQVMEKLFLEGFGCFSSLNSWSRAEGTESQGKPGLVCLLTFLSEHSHSPLLSHTAGLLWLRCVPRAGVSQTHGHSQGNLIQPRGGCSALLTTCTATTSQLLRVQHDSPHSQWVSSSSPGKGELFHPLNLTPRWNPHCCPQLEGLWLVLKLVPFSHLLVGAQNWFSLQEECKRLSL